VQNMNWKRGFLLFLAVMALNSCATIPKGPSIVAQPGPGKPFEVFQADDAACRQWASQQRGASQNQYDYAYQQCMYAKGNQMPGLSPPGRTAPPLPPPPPGFTPGPSGLLPPDAYPPAPQVQAAGKLLNNDDIISLTKAGLSDATILSIIQNSPTQLDLSTEALTKLSEASVSNTVIEAMVRQGGASLGKTAQQAAPTQGLQPPPAQKPSIQGTMNTLLTAIATNNYDAFVADAAPAFRTRITKEAFKGVNTQLLPRLKGGYELQYLGTLKQRDVEVFLWKIIYKDGGSDMLARLVLQDGKVAGFWIQ
jgi:hypothetical protein